MKKPLHFEHNTARQEVASQAPRLGASQARAWALCLYEVGLIPLPRWGGGHALPGTDHRTLADYPPDRGKAAQADYSGGMAILLGTWHPSGGSVVGIDVDEGPSRLSPPVSCLYLEAGIVPGRFHVFLISSDRFEGQLNLKDRAGKLVAELKGRGHALRCYPTRPPGKSAGYRPLFLASPNSLPSLTLTAQQIAEGFAHFLSVVLSRDVSVESQNRRLGLPAVPVSGPLAAAIAAKLEELGCNLKPAGRDGWQSGRCPFHQDRNPSFSISFEVGAWKCWAGCGSGGLGSLAPRLGIPPLDSGHRRQIRVFAVEA